MPMRTRLLSAVVIAAALLTLSASAKEYPIGKPKTACVTLATLVGLGGWVLLFWVW
jgi:hypothetical protein